MGNYFQPEITDANRHIYEKIEANRDKYRFVGWHHDIAPPVARGRVRRSIELWFEDTEAEIRCGFYSKGNFSFSYAREDYEIGGAFHFYTDIKGWHIKDPWSLGDGLLFSAPNQAAAEKKCLSLLPAAWRHHKLKRDFLREGNKGK